MFKNHCKLAWRNLVKDRQFTFLNLTGLSTGLASAILIYMWVSDEVHINKFNVNDSRLYQVMQITPDGNEAVEYTPGLLATALSQEMPEVEYAASVIPSTWFSNKGLFSLNNTRLRASVQFVSGDYFNIFSCHFIEGDKGQLFSRKHNIAISIELALKLFGTTDNIIGRTVEWNQEGFNGNYFVSAVFEKFPPNSTIQFDAVFNYDLFLEKRPQLLKWNHNDPATYVLLKQGTDVKAFNKKIVNFIKTKNDKSTETLYAQRFSDTYLYNHYANGTPDGGRIDYIRLFSLVAIFILAIACINFMNLSTAKAARRMKEAGIQKIIGASRRSLILQYIAESVLMAFCSLILAAILVIILLPTFKEITGKDFNLQLDAAFISSIGAITLVTGVIAGSYPALYLSGFKPVLVLKGNLKNSLSESFVRKTLVVFQFTISVVLIVSVVIVYRQMQLIQNINLGYNRDHIIYFEKGGKLADDKDYYKPGGGYEKDLETFIQQIKNIPGIVNACNFRHNITNRHGGTTAVSWQGKAPNDQTEFTDISAGYGFIETLGIQMKEGRTYSKDFGAEGSTVIFNEAAIESMGLKDPVGKTVNIWGEDKKIIGIAKNFHFESLYENIKPCFFDLSLNEHASKIMVRIKAGTEKSTIDDLSKFYKQYTGEFLDYRFLDDDYQALYASEQRVAALSRYFAAIAILISCVGLFGLAAFMVQKRQKEISIRKIIGASASNIIAMLSKDFLLLVSVALVIAMPIGWLIINQWLQSFAYRVSITLNVFFITGLAVILIALLTISFQTITAAITKPVASLRGE